MVEGKRVVLRFVKSGTTQTATLTYVYPPPRDFWDTVKQWAEGKRKIGKAKNYLVINIIVPESEEK